MKVSEWKTLFKEMLNGILGELGSTVPLKTKVALHAFRRRLDHTRGAKNRKRFEKEIEEFLQNDRVLRNATERYLGKKALVAIEAAHAALKLAQPFLAKNKPYVPPNLRN